MGIYGHKIDNYLDNQVLTEGFLKRLLMAGSKKVNLNKVIIEYGCSVNKNEKECYGGQKTIVEAIKWWLCAVYKGVYMKDAVTFTRESYYKDLEKDNSYIYISKYKHEINENGNTYGEKNKFTHLEISDEGHILDLMNKYNIKIEIKDNTAFINRRAKMFKDACKIAKKIIDDLSKEDPQIKKGFRVVNPSMVDSDAESLADFEDNMDDSCEIISCDAWEYTNMKARDQVEYEKYSKAFDKVFGEFKKQITFVSVDYYGDWDDGPIVIIDKNK